MPTVNTYAGCSCCGIASSCCSSGSMPATVTGTFSGALSGLGSVTFTYNSVALRWESGLINGTGCWPYQLFFQFSCQSIGGGSFFWLLNGSGFNAPVGVVFASSLSAAAPINCSPLSLTMSGTFTTSGISGGCSGSYSVTFTA